MTTMTDKEAETVYKTADEIDDKPTMLEKVIWLVAGMGFAGWLVWELL